MPLRINEIQCDYTSIIENETQQQNHHRINTKKASLLQNALISGISQNGYLSRDLQAQLSEMGVKKSELTFASKRNSRLLGGTRGKYAIDVVQIRQNSFDSSLTGRAVLVLSQGLDDMQVSCTNGVVENFFFRGKDYLNRDFLPASFVASERFGEPCYLHSYDGDDTCERYKVYLDLRNRNISSIAPPINSLTYQLVRRIKIIKKIDEMFALTIKWEDKIPNRGENLQLNPNPIPPHCPDLAENHRTHSLQLQRALEHTHNSALCGAGIGFFCCVVGSLVGGLIGCCIGAASADRAPDHILKMHTGGVRIIPKAEDEEKEKEEPEISV